MCETEGPIAHSSQCVYRHALLLAYLAFRGMVDHEQNPRAAKMAGHIPTILQEDWTEGLTLDAAEQRFVNTPFGSLTPAQRSEASWLIERMAVLAWAIGLGDLPPFYRKIDGAKVSGGLGMFRTGVSERIDASILRDADEVLMGGRTYAMLYWRLSEHAEGTGPIDLYQKVKDPESEHLTVNGLELHDRDLAIDGVPIQLVPEVQLGLAGAIVFQRYKGFRWLLGLERPLSTVTAIN